ncbi:MAG: DUF1992 domain-containing protein [Yoonia sp.]|nr:DUF1992 domain-containing protein [Yoonia sp.]
MTHPLDALIDQIVQAAEKRGDFDNLAGAGKPQFHPENPADAVLNRLMKEADAKSPVVVMRRQIFDGQAVLQGLTDPDARKDQMRYLADLQTRLAIEMEAFHKYG